MLATLMICFCALQKSVENRKYKYIVVRRYKCSGSFVVEELRKKKQQQSKTSTKRKKKEREKRDTKHVGGNQASS
jgi:hypothetical protein